MFIISGWVEFRGRNGVYDPVVAALICSAIPGTIVGWGRKALVGHFGLLIPGIRRGRRESSEFETTVMTHMVRHYEDSISERVPARIMPPGMQGTPEDPDRIKCAFAREFVPIDDIWCQTMSKGDSRIMLREFISYLYLDNEVWMQECDTV
jgi:hypothetical protein